MESSFNFRPKAERAPIKYIQFIHKKLFDICRQSGLEGLDYYGGPEVACKDCGRFVLRCVEYKTGVEEVTEAHSNPACYFCMEEYDVNKLLLVCVPLH